MTGYWEIDTAPPFLMLMGGLMVYGAQIPPLGFALWGMCLFFALQDWSDEE